MSEIPLHGGTKRWRCIRAIYLFFLLVLGIPVMTIEFSLGRASQKSPVRLYHGSWSLSGSKWHYHGYVALSGNYLLMMFLYHGRRMDDPVLPLYGVW